MPLHLNTFAFRLSCGNAFPRSVGAVAIGFVVSIAACQLACRTVAAEELQMLISASRSSVLCDASDADFDAADRALALSRAPLEMLAANSRTVVRQPSGSLMARTSSTAASASSGSAQSAVRPMIGRELAGRTWSGEASTLLPLSDAAIPLLVASLAADSPSANASPASLRPLTGAVVGVRSSWSRPGLAVGR